MFKKRFVAAMLTGAMLCGLALTGCGSGDGGSGKGDESSKASTESTQSVSSEKGSEESSEQESEEQDESSEESNEPESTAARDFDLENDIKLTTVAVNTVPFSVENFGEDNYVSSDKMTLITMIVQSEYIEDDLKYGCDIVTIDDKPHYTDDGDIFNAFPVYIYKDDSEDVSGHLYFLICAGEHKPSDYKLTFKFDEKDYSVPLSDEVSSVPEELVSNDVLHVGNIGLLGNDYYYVSSPDETGGGSADEKVEGYDDSNFSYYCGALLRLNADASTRLDLGKFSYEPDPGNAGSKFLERYKITITPNDVGEIKRSFKEGYTLTWLYGYNDSEPDDVLNELSEFNNQLVDYDPGFVVYEGTKIEVRLKKLI